MATRDDVLHDRRLRDSITIRVTSVDTNPRKPRDVELEAVDDEGNEVHVVIWQTHDVTQQWVEGQEYELSDVRGKRYSTRNGTRVELHSTSSFRAKQVNRAKSTRLLVLGDTHVGYRHRARSNKPVWARSVNAKDVFTSCLERARELDIDAVVHAGDVFDHNTTKADRKQVDNAIRRTVQSGTPFYYVYGNHDDKRGRRLLNSTPGVHLTTDAATLGTEAVNLLGVDHSGHSFPQRAPEASIEMVTGRNILVVHETPHPVVDSNGALVYQNDGNKADISGFVETAGYGIDCVVTGHLHVANQARIRGPNTPVLITGPTIPISTYKEDNQPSIWLLTVTEEGTEFDYRPI